MTPVTIPPTSSSPAIDFAPDQGRLCIRGESYPENCIAFYKPLFDALDDYLADDCTPPLRLEMEIIYFNSSSSKAFMDLFDLLDEAAAGGRDITVHWRYHEDNDIALECGEEFLEDVTALHFELQPIYG